MKKSKNEKTDLSSQQDELNDKKLATIQEEFQPISISSIETTITQFPTPQNDNVAIVQTSLTANGKKVSMSGFATPNTNMSEDTYVLLNAALNSSTKLAIDAMWNINDLFYIYEDVPLNK